MVDKLFTALVIAGLAIALFLFARAGKTMTWGAWVALALAIAACVRLLRFHPHVPADLVTGVFLGLFLIIASLSLIGLKAVRSPDSTVQPDFLCGRSHQTLFVLVHGFGGGPKTWRDVLPELMSRGDILQLAYPANAMSNADPEDLTRRMADNVRDTFAKGSYDHVVLIGHSVGALLVRKTYLQAAGKEGHEWIQKADRMVLLAGMNRGWDVTGKRPMDMSLGRQVLYWVGSWLGRLTRTGTFILSAELGAPFVSNLRLEWMRWFRDHPNGQPLVVQLLGDIDDMVSDEDNKDLRAAATTNFYWLRVRGTGHRKITDFRDKSGANAQYAGIGSYRLEKFELAIDKQAPELAPHSEEQPLATDTTVKRVVFVLHGIRDLGEWSANFEEALQPKPGQPAADKPLIVSLRYGYFSMGSFVMQPNRQKYVRWLMDQVTESLARYPCARSVEFFAHSNGTYLLASALDRYDKLHVNRVAFAGSVVRRQFPWNKVIIERKQVDYVRNYVARDDVVVGLFPRFFELPVIRQVLRNDVGSAGFNGFDLKGVEDVVENVKIRGGHGAFQNYVPQIAEFLLQPKIQKVPENLQPAGTPWQGQVSRWGILVIWAGLLFLVVFPAVRVASAAGEYAWIPVSIYIAIVLLVLKRL
jgi:pimeloyl-ACP methyl ester carboxylesterase